MCTILILAVYLLVMVTWILVMAMCLLVMDPTGNDGNVDNLPSEDYHHPHEGQYDLANCIIIQSV